MSYSNKLFLNIKEGVNDFKSLLLLSLKPKLYHKSFCSK